MIPHSKPYISEGDVEGAAAAIRSGMLVDGRAVSDFEEAFSNRIETSDSVAVSSGTAALHLSLIALGLGPRDEVVIPAYVCTAPLNAVRYVGARPVLSDVEPQAGISGAEEINRAITPRTRAVICVHLFGRSAPIDDISSLGVDVIEDSVQAVGGLYKGCPIGSFGTVSVFSFYATKVMTTGHGGMVSSKDEDLMDKVRDLIHYDQREDKKLRYNYQMTSFQAALGLSQLGWLDEFLSRRKKIAQYYHEEFQRAGIDMPAPAPMEEDIHYRFIIKAPGRVKDVIDRLSDLGVRAMRPVFLPLYFYTGDEELVGTKKAYEEDVSIPIYPALTDSDVERISDAVKAVFRSL